MSWRCNNCESVNSDAERRCHVCGAIREAEPHTEPWPGSAKGTGPAGTDSDERRRTEIKKKPEKRTNTLVILLTLISFLTIFFLLSSVSSRNSMSKSDFIATCQAMPSYQAVLNRPMDYQNETVKLNLSVEQALGYGRYRCVDDAYGDLSYAGYEYYVIDRRGASADAFETYDVFTAYCLIAGTKQVTRTSTGEVVTLVKLDLKYIDPAPIATPTPRPTPAPTATPWPTETINIDGETVTAYIVDLCFYEWDQFSEWSESKQVITKDTWSYPCLLKGAIENCFGIRIRRYSAETTLGDPFSVPFKGVVRLRDGKWSSGDANNAFEYVEGTEVDVYILFQQPASFSAVDIIPTKAQKRECSWDPNYYSPILYFATMDDAKRYVDSIG